MSLSIENLMLKRFKVIADYPNNSTYSVGEIFTPRTDRIPTSKITEYYKDYPHIFKPLLWYEERSIEDMPEYVKLDVRDKIVKIHHWDETASLGWCEEDCRDYHCDNCLPATEEEYLNFINQKVNQ